MSANYFSSSTEEFATRSGSWADLEQTPGVELGPGLFARPLVGGDCMITYVVWDFHAQAPEHAHAEEQIVLVIEGEVEIGMEGETRVLRSGQAAVIPPWVRHSARSRAHRSVTVEAFAPPRAAFLALLAHSTAPSSG
ncbi:cupin domain-containing protein [Mycobacterium avium]|uniref:cupin domain-containing protein n=1 Tax=Mycobacterium avium TaxID=1764 RepID=UPI001CC349D2|nr:cupin domain-containing protein [Mycobacterium avium]MBZ4521792.1 cupin domain-containing protein [Mycobacterium avium subsp. hominissuis]MBZ4531196.1 cupin domain-containing protein [Mycobacterium avium subsp. hominissuis]